MDDDESTLAPAEVEFKGDDVAKATSKFFLGQKVSIACNRTLVSRAFLFLYSLLCFLVILVCGLLVFVRARVLHATKKHIF